MPGAALAAEGRRVMRLNVRLANPTADPLRDQRLWIYLPAMQAAHVHPVEQSCNQPHSLLGDELGHCIAQLPVDLLPAYGQRMVNITVALEPGPGAVVAEQPERWLAAQATIESDHSDIRALAATIGGPSPAETARRAYQWVAAHMTYAGYLTQDFGALHALRTGSGDCTEYASLVVALCRASGIPARLVGGYVSERSFVARPMEYHNWAEIWLEGRWRVADAQLGRWLDAEGAYIPLRYCWDTRINPVGLAHRYRVEGEMVATL